MKLFKRSFSTIMNNKQFTLYRYCNKENKLLVNKQNLDNIISNKHLLLLFPFPCKIKIILLSIANERINSVKYDEFLKTISLFPELNSDVQQSNKQNDYLSGEIKRIKYLKSFDEIVP